MKYNTLLSSILLFSILLGATFAYAAGESTGGRVTRAESQVSWDEYSTGLDRSCVQDSDCSIKLVGRACSPIRTCVNVNAVVNESMETSGICVTPPTIVRCACENRKCSDVYEDDSNRTQTPRNLTNMRALCERKESKRERIACRLQLQRNFSLEDLNLTEESCRDVRDTQGCMHLYAQVRACYDHTGRQKDQCFKRIAGFVNKNVSQERDNPVAIRRYMVFILYNMQERVEEANKAGTITADQATQLITLIVDLKQQILNGGLKSEIRAKLESLKVEWRAVMR